MKIRANRNKTITLNNEDKINFEKNILFLSKKTKLEYIENRIINQDIFNTIKFLPHYFIDLLFADPPYNLEKKFNSNKFKQIKDSEYEKWLDSWISKLVPFLKPTASIYICGDWKSSAAIYRILSKYFIIRNRISWEREKGRGAKTNWKNCSEDIWFATVSNNYYFNAEAVKLKKKVIAPYRDIKGDPKDWMTEKNGNFRLTYSSNFWTDLTIPFWSMPENTEHPTQKPEKLLAKIILASSKKNELVFDPFLGSGTTAIVAYKLNRKFCGVEIDKEYSLLAVKRIKLAEQNKSIQGYKNGVFWERNSI